MTVFASDVTVVEMDTGKNSCCTEFEI